MLGQITMKVGVSASGQVWSLQGATAEQIYSDVSKADTTTANGYYEPQFRIDDDLGEQEIPEGENAFCYAESGTIKIMFPDGETKKLDLASLVNISKYTACPLDVQITCVDAQGNEVAVTNGKIELSEKNDYTVTYTVTDQVFYDNGGQLVENTQEFSWKLPITVSLKKSLPNAYFEFDSTQQKIYYAGLSSYTQFIPFLSGLKIYDYNDAEGEPYCRFDGGNIFAVHRDQLGNGAVDLPRKEGGIFGVFLHHEADALPVALEMLLHAAQGINAL